MRTNNKNEVIITKKKAAELFVLLGYARYKLQGKMKSDCEKFHKELEIVFGLKIEWTTKKNTIAPITDQVIKLAPTNPIQVNIRIIRHALIIKPTNAHCL